MSSVGGLGRKILGILASLLSLGLIFYTLKPVFNWYLGKTPALGVDLYYTATYVAYHLKHFSLPLNTFKDIWFGGYPFFNDIFQLHFYLMIPFAAILGLIEGIRMYVVVALFGLGVACFVLYQKLARNIVLGIILTIFVLYSVNIYGAATWGGSIPYFASQLFFPLAIFLLVKYLSTGDRRWFYAAIAASGIGALGHPQPQIAFTIPTAFFLLIFWQANEFSYKVLTRFLDFAIFVVLTILISLRIFFPFIQHIVTSFFQGYFLAGVGFVAPGVGDGAQRSGEIAAFYKSLARLLITDTNYWLFYFLGVGFLVFCISLIFANRLKKIGQVLPFLLITAYIAGQVTLNAYGFTILAQGWYRAFWPFPIAVGAATAVLWGQFFQVIKLSGSGQKIWLKSTSLVVWIVISAAFLLAGYYFFSKESKGVIEKIEAKSEFSSAFPEILSIKFDKKSLEELKKSLKPQFIDSGDKNKRLYTADATVNIWWNALYDMPLARGYVDPPIGAGDRGGFFLLDIAIANDSLVRDFGFDENTAYNTTLFMIDWYGIYYFEGGRLSSKGPAPPPSSYLLKNNIFEAEEEVTTYGAVLKWQTASGKPELHYDIPQTLKFFKFKDEFTSPVLAPTNSPAILVFTDKASYEDLMRTLAASNLNSKYLIPVAGGKFIDEFKESELENFKAIILHNYSYHNKKKAFEILSNFVKEGGKIFIDTGAESKDSNSDNLPEIFPVKSSKREGLGKAWEFEIKEDKLTANVDFSQFGPPIFGQDEWKIAFAPSEEAVRNGATIILRQKGKPVLARQSYGAGEVIWSGLNLLYHINQYKSQTETLLFTNVIKHLTPIEKTEIVPAQAEWLRPEKVTLTSRSGGATGVLFKEQAYDGWSAKLASNGKNLPIYQVGPTFPGFMYVPLEEVKDKPFKVEFKYSGEKIACFVFVISTLTIILLLEKVFLNGVLIGRRLGTLAERISKKIKSWWEREEE